MAGGGELETTLKKNPQTSGQGMDLFPKAFKMRQDPWVTLNNKNRIASNLKECKRKRLQSKTSKPKIFFSNSKREKMMDGK